MTRLTHLTDRSSGESCFVDLNRVLYVKPNGSGSYIALDTEHHQGVNVRESPCVIDEMMGE